MCPISFYGIGAVKPLACRMSHEALFYNLEATMPSKTHLLAGGQRLAQAVQRQFSAVHISKILAVRLITATCSGRAGRVGALQHPCGVCPGDKGSAPYARVASLGMSSLLSTMTSLHMHVYSGTPRSRPS